MDFIAQRIRDRWMYRGRTVAPDGKPDVSATLDTRGDRVVDVGFEDALALLWGGRRSSSTRSPARSRCRWVHVRRFGVAQQVAQIQEVLLGGTALRKVC